MKGYITTPNVMDIRLERLSVELESKYIESSLVLFQTGIKIKFMVSYLSPIHFMLQSPIKTSQIFHTKSL